MDMSLRIPRIDRLVPIAKSLTLYGEFGSDDETNGTLDTDELGYLAGVYFGDLFLTGRTDLKVEYAENNTYGDSNWYLHQYYRSGMTYKGDVFAHHMGNDSKDIFVRITHYITEDWLIGLDCRMRRSGGSRQQARSHSTSQPARAGGSRFRQTPLSDQI